MRLQPRVTSRYRSLVIPLLVTLAVITGFPAVLSHNAAIAPLSAQNPVYSKPLNAANIIRNEDKTDGDTRVTAEELEEFGIYWDADTKTLTMDNASIVCDTAATALTVPAGGTIVLKGENRITLMNDPGSVTIYAIDFYYGGGTIQGEDGASLQINGFCNGIKAFGSLTISHCFVDINVRQKGIHCVPEAALLLDGARLDIQPLDGMDALTFCHVQLTGSQLTIKGGDVLQRGTLTADNQSRFIFPVGVNWIRDSEVSPDEPPNGVIPQGTYQYIEGSWLPVENPEEEDTPADGFTLFAQIAGDNTHFNPGDEIAVDLYLSAAQTATAGGLQFTADYDDAALTLTGAEPAVSGHFQSNLASGECVFVADGEGFSAGTTAVKVVRLTFTVRQGIDGGESRIGVRDTEVSLQGASQGTAANTQGTDFTLHNIRLQFASGTGTDMPEEGMYLYARYGEAGLYADSGYQTPAQPPEVTAMPGYRLPADTAEEPMWESGSTAYPFAALQELTLTDGLTLTARSIKQWTVCFTASQGGSLEGLYQLTVDDGTTLTADDLPVPIAEAGKTFAGWEPDPVGAAVTGDAGFMALFCDNAATVILPDGTAHKVITGQAFTFTPTVDGAVVIGVHYTAEGGEAVPLAANTDGSYTIPGEAVAGSVVVTAELLPQSDISFITKDSYKITENGTKILRLHTEQRSVGGYTLAGGEILYWSAAYGAYIAIVPQSVTEAVLAAALRIVPEANEALCYGDVNGDGRITAVDGLIINDLLHGKRSADTPEAYRLRADVNGDMAVTTADILRLLEVMLS